MSHRRRVKSPLEVAAREANWARGRVGAFRRTGLRLVYELAPQSVALPRVIAGVSECLLWWVAQQERKAREHAALVMGNPPAPAQSEQVPAVASGTETGDLHSIPQPQGTT